MKKNEELTTREILQDVIARKNKELGLPADKILSLCEAEAIVSAQKNRKKQSDDVSDVPEPELIDMLAQCQNDIENDDTEIVSNTCVIETDLSGNKMPDKETTVCIKVPSRFSPEFADKFALLDAEWQDYLCSLDAEITREINEIQAKLNEHQWMDTLHQIKCFNHLSDETETPREWVEKMAFMEYMLETNPRDALKTLARLYLRNNAAVAHHHMMRRMYCPITIGDYFHQQRIKSANKWFDAILTQTDETGALKYPHQAAVRDMIIGLLRVGQSCNVPDAYQTAIWCDEKVREKLVQEKVSELIRKKAAEVRRAKKAAFAPCGTGSAESPAVKELTTRELLEEAARKYRHKYIH